MAAIHDAERTALLRSAAWNGFWDGFASPFMFLADLIWPREPESVQDRVNRRLARYGLTPIELDPDPGSVTGAWYAVGNHVRRAFAELERDYGAQVRSARITKAESRAKGAAEG